MSRRDFLKHLGFTTKTAITMSNNERKSAVNAFKKGDIVIHETTSILVTGEGASQELFAGVIIEQTDLGNVGKIHAIGDYSRSWHSWKFGKVAGATEYATKLNLLQQENEELIRWKMEAVEFQIPIISYCHKHLEVKIGDSSTALVIAELDRLRQENITLKAQQGAVWVKGAPKKRQQCFAKVPSIIDDNVIYDAIIVPVDSANHWWAHGPGFRYTVRESDIIEYLDESQSKEGEKEVKS
jgi:hypothetical protein